MTTTDSGLPPPPPPPPAATGGYDFARPFTFAFEDPDWVSKVLIGGLFYLAGFLLIGYVFILGYLARLARNVVARVERPLPAWDDLGSYFVDGLKLAFVAIIYMLPLVVLGLMMVIPAALMENAGNGNASDLYAGCVLCLLFPLGLAVAVLLPAGLLRVAVTGRMGAGFDVVAVFGFIRNNLGNYLLAFLIHIIAGFLAQFGVILFCIGVIFTAFLSLLISAYAFAQVWAVARIHES